MQISTGDYVVYYGTGICKIEGLAKKSFDGVHELEYYCLTPYNSDGSTYYIPSDSLSERTRKLLTGDEILALIDRIPGIEPVWSNNNNERRNLFGSLLKSNDYGKIFCLLKSLYHQRAARLDAGKKLSSADEKTMKTAENIVSQEFSFVLGIKPEQVTDFISERINRKYGKVADIS